MPRALDTAVLFRALGDPTRLALFELLARGPAPVSALAEPFDMTLTAVGQHLAILEAAGLIESDKLGRVRTCRCNPGALDRLEGWLAARRRLVTAQLGRLGALLDARFPATQNTARSRQRSTARPKPRPKERRR